jgi:adenylate kinase family enzyme
VLFLVERVVVYGTGGSGKSTYAASLGLPHVELDTFTTDFRVLDRAAFDAAIAGDQWVVEGVHRDELWTALERADTFVWLDPPRRVIAWRLLRRRRRTSLVAELRWIAKTLRNHERRRAHGQRFADAARERGIDVIHRTR